MTTGQRVALWGGRRDGDTLLIDHIIPQLIVPAVMSTVAEDDRFRSPLPTLHYQWSHARQRYEFVREVP